MADVATTFSTLSNDAPNVYIAREMFRLSERNLRIGKYAKLHTLPQRMSKTLRVVRYKRLNLPFSTLTEGTPPDAVALATENVDVTVEQWGIVVLLTDVALITTVHPALQIAIDRTSLAIAEVLEREMANVLLSGTQVYFPGTATSRPTIGSSDKMDTATVLKSTVALRNLGAGEQEGGLFGGVMAPQQEGDVLSADQTFKDASNFANVRALQFGEIGIWMGVRWARGNFLPIFKGVPTPSTTAATAEKAQIVVVGGGASMAGSLVVVVARDITTNYERKISQTFTVTDVTGAFNVIAPSSANYVYDIYVSDTAGLNFKKLFSRVAASSTNLVNATIYAAGTLATPPSAPADQREVFVAWVFGLDSFGRVELNGMSLESYITPPGASFSNPLAQGRKVGTKIMWKSFIIDNNFFARIESASAFSAQLPS